MPSSISLGFPRKEFITVALGDNAGHVDQNIFIAGAAFRIVGAKWIHSTAGNDAGAVTVNLHKLTGTNTPAQGTALLTNNSNAGFDCKGTANTVQTGTFVTTTGALDLKPGDRLALNFTGTITTLAGGCITIELKRLGG